MLYFFLFMLVLLVILGAYIVYLSAKYRIKLDFDNEELRKATLADKLSYDSWQNGFPELGIPPTNVFERLGLPVNFTVETQLPDSPEYPNILFYLNASLDTGIFIYIPAEINDPDFGTMVNRFAITFYCRNKNNHFHKVSVNTEHLPKGYLAKLRELPLTEMRERLKTLAKNLLAEWIRLQKLNKLFN